MKPTEDPEGPDTFTVDGMRWERGEDGRYVETDRPWEEAFTLLPEIPPGAHLDLISGAVLDEDGGIAWNQFPIVRFIRAVIIPEDEARWDDLIRDKTRRLQTESLGALMFWITGEKTGRPTGRQSSSSGGLPPANNGSEAEPSPADATTPGLTPPA